MRGSGLRARVAVLLLLLLLLLVVAVAVAVGAHKAQSEMQEEMEALKERVSDLERRLLLLLHEEAQDDVSLPLISELSSMPLETPHSQTSLLSVQVAQAPGPQQEQQRRQQLLENLVMMVTPHALSLYSMDCRRIILHNAFDELPDGDPTSQVLVSVATSPDDNLVLVGRTSAASSTTLLQSFALSAWRVPFNASSPASTSMRLRLALQPELAFRPSSPAVAGASVTALATYNRRFYKLYIVGFSNGVMQVFTRNGTLKYTVESGGVDAVVALSQTRPRTVTFATPHRIGFFRLSQVHYVENECSFDKVASDESITSLGHQSGAGDGRILYVGTSAGRVLVFDLEKNMRQMSSCGIIHTLITARKEPLMLLPLQSVLLVQDCHSLYVYNISARVRQRPRLYFEHQLQASAASASCVPVLDALQDPYGHTFVAAMQQTPPGASSRLAVLQANIRTEPPNTSIQFMRAPVFVLGIVGVLIWQFMQRRKGGGGGSGSELGGAQLSREDEAMLSDILRKQNSFSSSTEAAAVSSRSRRRHYRGGSTRRVYEQRSFSSVSQSDDDDRYMRGDSGSGSDQGEGVGFGIEDNAGGGYWSRPGTDAALRQRKLDHADSEGEERATSALGNREKHD